MVYGGLVKIGLCIGNDFNEGNDSNVVGNDSNVVGNYSNVVGIDFNVVEMIQML